MDAPSPAAQHDGADPTVLGALQAQLLRLVVERGYTRSDEPFVLSSGGTSHDYVDLRRAVARGEDLHVAARAVVATLGALGVAFDAIGGMTMGADPVAHAVAMLSGTAWFSVRKNEKAYGAKRRIEGYAIGPGVRVVLFEDTVSTSRSLLEAIDAVAATGADIVQACTLLDRGDSTAPLLDRRSIPYHALLTYRDLAIAPIVPAAGGSPAAGAEGGTPD